MSLSVGKLSSGLQAFAVPGAFPASAGDAGDSWSAAYVAYAADAVVSFGAQVTAAQGEAALAAALAAVFPMQTSTSSGIAAALTAFWLSPPVQFTGSRTGLVTAVGGTAALAAALDAAFAANIAGQASAQIACTRIANAIHTFTKTVSVRSPTPAPPVISLVS